MEYRVLARKYRPTNFDDLIGQEVLVQTLSNAIKSSRIAHAFLLTGIRGIGKTTTARIIARALNCEQGPTINPCGTCSQCKMIGEDRHVDVLEMDAASHTGVGDIRELIDTVRYLPSSARYKIYIIDEVHMLSTSAFNALLKTLEEPPPHVKFIFATTESRKIPVTILSRCQRFDLKRIDMDMLAAHLSKIAGKEDIKAEDEALKLIGLAAEGSVRDALSLLDQAIARTPSGEAISGASVRQMIGGADNTATFRLLETLLKGDIAQALAELRGQYTSGADPLLIVQDALEVTHLITRVKVAPGALTDVSLSQHDREQAKKMADALSMPILTRLWQMLLKGITEVRTAPAPMSALEMLLVRIAYAAQLPTPAEVIKNEGFGIQDSGFRKQSSAPVVTTISASAPSPESRIPNPESSSVNSFPEAVALFEKHREPLKHTQLMHDVRLVRFEPGKIDLHLTAQFPRDFTAQIAACLTQWTGQKWAVTVSNEAGEPSLHEQAEARKEKKLEQATAHPLVSSMLEQFPGAKIVGVKENA